MRWVHFVMSGSMRSGQIKPPQPADIDGCEGNDTVLLRQGPFNDEAQRQTRVLFIDQDEVEVLRTETYTYAIHQLVLAELDGTPPSNSSS